MQKILNNSGTMAGMLDLDSEIKVAEEFFRFATLTSAFGKGFFGWSRKL